MATPRSLFLLPFHHLSRPQQHAQHAVSTAISASSSAVSSSSLSSSASQNVTRGIRRGFQSRARKQQGGTVTQRYGTANEPPPHLGPPPTATKGDPAKDSSATATAALVGSGEVVVDPKQRALPKPAVAGTSSAASGVKAKTERKARGKKGEEAKEAKTVQAPAAAVQSQAQKGAQAQAQAEAEVEVKADPKVQAQAEPEVEAKADKDQEPTTTAQQPQAQETQPKPSPNQAKTQSPLTDAPAPTPAPGAPQLPSADPLRTVLNMPSSDELEKARSPAYYHENASTNPDDHRPPHISTPRYIHHFDTYGLVQRLEAGGLTDLQSVTLMKAVRLILADNMDLAREGLVSKSNVENETYLFRAACSELRTEIQTKRKAEVEKSRTERTQLQHEVDILGQRLTQEGGNLKDELKGMFDDRKMAVRNEQRSMESKIQELNYRITVALNSDSRSDVEGVRWIVTKRAIAALFICVVMVIGSLKYTSTMMQTQEEERRRFAALNSQKEGDGRESRGGDSRGGGGGGGDHRGSTGMGNKDMGTQTMGAGEMLVQEGDNPAFVSLG